MNKRILITGSNGLLGQKLVDLLLPKTDVEILATSKGANKLASVYPELQFQNLDITSLEDIARVFESFKPTHVINTAAQTNVDVCEDEAQKEACYLQNALAVKYLAEACEKFNTHLTHVSTDFIFDGENGPYTEEAEAKPVNYYGETKLAGEEFLKQAKCPWAIARTIVVYGIVHDYGRSNLVLWVKESLENEKAIQVVNDQFRSPTLAEDLAMGCWQIVEQDATGIFNLSGPDFLTPYEMALQVADYFKLDKSFIKEASAANFVQPAKRPPRTGFKIEKARKVLGYNPRPFSEGVRVVAEQIPA
ncbi:SDR family oxidoreductase [Adhaeribacter sp. BT258]|uniref:dTDP-4-dehydrorhamnose reductase n=1 Tax=Adhaeribacter terrigena TaxID=2793070 RepID=A0ABS1BZ27_9BACT|nr:SDR family oxidoreductase [Adhaeribacter terrigena]MBK0401525.1 SDR family oxidoreductase [Adhaeribacter terrigena]